MASRSTESPSSTDPAKRKPFKILLAFNRLIAQYEKVILAGLSVVIVISGSIWFKQIAQDHTDPAVGGSYVEGIVGSETEMGQVAARLTKAGLFSISESGKLENLLVTDWRANPEQTEYQFFLKEGVNADEIAEGLTRNSDIIAPLETEIRDNALVVTLASANANLPVLLAQPLFDYGPYKLSKFTNQTSVFTRNTKEEAAKAFINKVVVHAYDNQESLYNALSKGKLNGAVVDSSSDSIKGYHSQVAMLPRYYAVLFNTNKSPLRDLSFRKNLIEGSSGSGTPFTLTAADREPYKSLATEQVAKWQANGVQVTLELKPFEEVRDKIMPSRNFQAIVTGLDYGIENDPFYLWHSSQVRPPGNNLTGIRDEVIDQAIGNIEQSTDLAKRQDLVNTIHQRLAEQAVTKILKQESFNLVLSDEIRSTTPWLAATQYDHFQSLNLWSIR